MTMLQKLQSRLSQAQSQKRAPLEEKLLLSTCMTEILGRMGRLKFLSWEICHLS
uniref:Alternative protein PCDHGA3 n=1 Tax=Homo sapiens TaxID=9606 RepID=L8EAH5_HUMAN|nr:alternative protein PCDHGA3 [Homo sapiens]